MLGKKTGGRKKGTANKFNACIKDMIHQALDESGGVKYLKLQAINNPTAFMSLIGRIIPSVVKNELTGKDGGAIETKQITEVDQSIINQYMSEKKNEL